MIHLDFIDPRMNRFRPSAGHQGSLRPVLLALSLGASLFGLIGCGSSSAVSRGSEATLPNRTADTDSDPLAGVPDDFELEIKVLVGSKVTDQDVLERRRAHIVLFPDGSRMRRRGAVIRGASGARPPLLRGQVADAWSCSGALISERPETLPPSLSADPGKLKSFTSSK